LTCKVSLSISASRRRGTVARTETKNKHKSGGAGAGGFVLSLKTRNSGEKKAKEKWRSWGGRFVRSFVRDCIASNAERVKTQKKKKRKKKMKKTSRLRLTVAARMRLRDRLRQERSSLHARDDHDHRGGNEIRFQVTMTKGTGSSTRRSVKSCRRTGLTAKWFVYDEWGDRRKRKSDQPALRTKENKQIRATNQSVKARPILSTTKMFISLSSHERQQIRATSEMRQARLILSTTEKGHSGVTARASIESESSREASIERGDFTAEVSEWIGERERASVWVCVTKKVGEEEGSLIKDVR